MNGSTKTVLLQRWKARWIAPSLEAGRSPAYGVTIHGLLLALLTGGGDWLEMSLGSGVKLVLFSIIRRVSNYSE